MNHRKCVLKVAISVSLFLSISIASAQPTDDTSAADERERNRSGELVLSDYDLVLNRPDGWLIGQAGRGTVAVLRPVGEPTSQIEVRASTGITPVQKTSYFASFHSTLRQSGFIETEALREVIYGQFRGEQTDYRVTSGGHPYRLLVWQYHRNNTAWLFVGFFPERRARAHSRGFESLIRSMRFSSNAQN